MLRAAVVTSQLGVQARVPGPSSTGRNFAGSSSPSR